MHRAPLIATTAALVATIACPTAAPTAEPPFPPEAVGLRRALYVDQHGLGPNDTPGSVVCDDARPRSVVTVGTPWCSLTNGAFGKVLPGDIVWVRAGTYAHSATGAQAGFPKFAFALTRRGSPTNHIWYAAYPGESVSIEPARPDGGPANCTFNGGGANSFAGCQWVGLGVAPVGWLGTDDGTCHTPPQTWRKDGACSSDADCGGTSGSCHRNSVECIGDGNVEFGACKYYVTVSGFRFAHWNHWDKRLNSSTDWPTPAGGVAARLSYYAVELGRHSGSPSQITIQKSEFTDNTNVIFTQQADGLTIQDNWIHDNHTHGFTSCVNLWQARGALNGPNIVRRNVITGCQDDAPTWCLSKVCTDPGVDGPSPWGRGNTCTDSVGGYGMGCTCITDANCQSGRCADSPVGAGGCDGNQPWNDSQTEGNAVIFDMPQGLCTPTSGIAGYCTYAGDPKCPCQMARGGALVMESNVVYANYGACLNGTRSDNVVFRNNTCVGNGLKKRPDTDAEVTTFGSIALHNNILRPPDFGTCKCASDTDCGGARGSCQNTGGIGLYCRTGTKSRCTRDDECPSVPSIYGIPAGRQCLGVQALELITAQNGDPNRYPYTFYAGDTEIGGNVIWHDMPNASPALLTIAPGAIALQHGVDAFALSSWATTYGWAGQGSSLGQRFGDPRFREPPLDFSLTAASAAIGAGDPLLQAATDQQGRSWYTPDAGARAYLPGAPSTTTTTLRPPPSTLPTTTTTTRPPVTTTTTTTFPGSTTTIPLPEPVALYTTEAPSRLADADNPVELGVRFTVSQPVVLAGIAAYLAAQPGIRYPVALYRAGDAAPLVTGSFIGSGTGWHTATLTSPLPLDAGVAYVASYHTSHGGYAFEAGAFATERARSVLTAPATTLSAPNGLYRYGAPGAIPTLGFQGASYYVTPLVGSPTIGTTTTSTVVTTTSTTTSTTVVTTTSTTTTTSSLPDPCTDQATAADSATSAIRIRRFGLSPVGNTYDLRANGRFPFASGSDPATSGLTLSVEDAAGNILFTRVLRGSELVPTRLGWGLAKPLPDLSTLDLDPGADSVQLTARATLPRFTLVDAAGNPTTKNGPLLWRVRFGNGCASTATVLCATTAGGNLSCALK